MSFRHSYASSFSSTSSSPVILSSLADLSSMSRPCGEWGARIGTARVGARHKLLHAMHARPCRRGSTLALQPTYLDDAPLSVLAGAGEGEDDVLGRAVAAVRDDAHADVGALCTTRNGAAVWGQGGGTDHKAQGPAPRTPTYQGCPAPSRGCGRRPRRRRRGRLTGRGPARELGGGGEALRAQTRHPTAPCSRQHLPVPSYLDDRGAALLHGGDKVAVQVGVVLDDLRGVGAGRVGGGWRCRIKISTQRPRTQR